MHAAAAPHIAACQICLDQLSEPLGWTHQKYCKLSFGLLSHLEVEIWHLSLLTPGKSKSADELERVFITLCQTSLLIV